MSEIRERIVKILEESKISFMEDNNDFDYKEGDVVVDNKGNKWTIECVDFNGLWSDEVHLKTSTPSLGDVRKSERRVAFEHKYKPASTEISEDIEVQPDMFGGEDTYYKDGRQAVRFMDVLDFMSEIAPDLDYTGDKQTKGLYWMIYNTSTGSIDSNKVADIESKLTKRFGKGTVTVRLANSQYAPEIKRIYIGFVDVADVEDDSIEEAAGLEEGWKDNLKKGVATLGVAGALAGNAMAHDPMYDGARRPFEDTNMTVQQVQQLSDEEDKATVLPNGMIKDQYGNEWTQEDWEKLMRGEDPFADNDDVHGED